ncbi:MAG: hypothetical protein HLX50_18245, partial [Alteromonadaceae bacterium]|nr:hypothetical protein [Alteromonadaceae bacterium]
MLSNKSVGNIGEGEFKKWCDQAGLIANKSLEDDSSGWDYFVDFPEGLKVDPGLAHKSEIRLKVQIKTTRGGVSSNNNAITLSNLRKLVSDPLPAFVVFIELDEDNEASKVVVVHIGDFYIRSVLKRIVENYSRNSELKLNESTMNVDFKKGRKLKKPYSKSLKYYLEESVGESFSGYIEEKKRLLENVGFEDGCGVVSFEIAGRENLRRLVDVSMGSEPETTLEQLSIRRQRFGIPYGDEEVVMKPQLKFDPKRGAKKGYITFKQDEFSAGVKIKARAYLRSVANMLPREEVYFRIDCGFFDMKVFLYERRIDLNITIDYQEKQSLKELRNKFRVLAMLSGLGKEFIVSFDFKGLDVEIVQPGQKLDDGTILEVAGAIDATYSLLHKFDVSGNVKVSAEEVFNLYEAVMFLNAEFGAGFSFIMDLPSTPDDIDRQFPVLLIAYWALDIGEANVGGIYAVEGNVVDFEGKEVISCYKLTLITPIVDHGNNVDANKIKRLLDKARDGYNLPQDKLYQNHYLDFRSFSYVTVNQVST